MIAPRFPASLVVAAALVAGSAGAAEPPERAEPPAPHAAEQPEPVGPPSPHATEQPEPADPPTQYAAERAALAGTVERHRASVGRRDGADLSDAHWPAVRRAIETVPRHEFVPASLAAAAHDDRPLPIGDGQTISQPFIVAYMTELARVEAGDRVLEIGTGSGYQAAVLAAVGAEVYTVEIVERLGQAARERLERLGYDRVHVRVGDGSHGWPQAAPFNAIVVTAAPETVPPKLVEQLAADGRMVVPVGPAGRQVLAVVERDGDGKPRRRDVLSVRFVPFTGEAGVDR